jgi:phosphohistidine phosphatase
MFMRRLMLLRHAKSDWSVGGQRDIDRTLAPRGREVAPLMGRYMAQHGLAPDRVLVSSARRTRETWELLAPEFGEQPAFGYEPRLYEASAKAILAVVHETAADIHTLLLIGHNPGLQEIAAKLMATGEIDARQQLMEKFPTAALAVLDFPTDAWTTLKPSSGRLDRFVTPKALRPDPE